MNKTDNLKDQYDDYENMYDVNNYFDVANFNEKYNNQFSFNENPTSRKITTKSPSNDTNIKKSNVFKPLDMTLKEHLIGTKDAFIETPKDIYHRGLSKDIFTSRRLFYIGITLLLIGLIGIFIVYNTKNESKKSNIQ